MTLDWNLILNVIVALVITWGICNVLKIILAVIVAIAALYIRSK